MRSSPSATDQLFAGPLGYAHRGLHGPGVPENSMAAFCAALEIGAGIECDLRLSSDGKAVLFHDPDLTRMCGLPAETASLRAHELGGHRLGDSEECIPALADLLALVDGRVPLLLELKPVPNIDALSATVADHLTNYTGAVGVMSFTAEVGRWFAQHQSRHPRGLVVDAWVVSRPGDALAMAQPNFLAVHKAQACSAWAAAERSAGLPIASWTIITRTERERLADCIDAPIWEGDGRP